MPEQLDLATPEAAPPVTDWRIEEVRFDRATPSIITIFRANTGEERAWRLVPGPGGVTESQINNALSFINQGKFKTVQNKSLDRWLFEQWQANGGPEGTISGTPD